jgi:phosphoglycolate phosphatase
LNSGTSQKDFTSETLPRAGISHVVFDFDGTLSWLRHGWPELMVGLFVDHIPAANPQERDSHRDQLLHDILSLNGRSSIFQMERCAERVLEHGGPRLDPQQVLAKYLTALDQTLRERKARVKNGGAIKDEFVVHGARALLDQLHRRGLVLVILSGTVESQVKEEAELLDLAKYFGRHIYGGTSDLVKSSKQAVLERLMREEQLHGSDLLSFGDGPVEIALTKQAGGVAVGVASDEDQNGSGKLDPHKAVQLRQAGADRLIADYRDPDQLIHTLFGSGDPR